MSCVLSLECMSLELLLHAGTASVGTTADLRKKRPPTSPSTSALAKTSHSSRSPPTSAASTSRDSQTSRTKETTADSEQTVSHMAQASSAQAADLHGTGMTLTVTNRNTKVTSHATTLIATENRAAMTAELAVNNVQVKGSQGNTNSQAKPTQSLNSSKSFHFSSSPALIVVVVVGTLIFIAVVYLAARQWVSVARTRLRKPKEDYLINGMYTWEESSDNIWHNLMNSDFCCLTTFAFSLQLR